jgi:hypothetical protein
VVPEDQLLEELGEGAKDDEGDGCVLGTGICYFFFWFLFFYLLSFDSFLKNNLSILQIVNIYNTSQSIQSYYA